jgi:hypothetical protein
MSRLIKIWNNYWFRPAPLFNLAVVRIIAVSLQIWLISIERLTIVQVSRMMTLPDSLYQPVLFLRLLALPLGGSYRPSPETFQLIATLTIIAGLLAIFGLLTNYSLLVFTLGNLIIVALNYSFGEFHHPDALMMFTLIALTLSPSGRVLSIDSWIRHKRFGSLTENGWFSSILDVKSIFAYWPLKLVQCLYGLVYLSSAVAKMHNAGLDWMNGYTLRYNLLDSGVRPVYPLGLWLGGQQGLSIILSWMTVLFEGTFWLAVIFPRLAWLYIPAGIGIHLGIFLTMGPDFFEFIVLYIVFIPWASVFKFVQGRLFPKKQLPEMEPSQSYKHGGGFTLKKSHLQMENDRI